MGAPTRPSIEKAKVCPKPLRRAQSAEWDVHASCLLATSCNVAEAKPTSAHGRTFKTPRHRNAHLRGTAAPYVARYIPACRGRHAGTCTSISVGLGSVEVLILQSSRLVRLEAGALGVAHSMLCLYGVCSKPLTSHSLIAVACLGFAEWVRRRLPLQRARPGPRGTSTY